MSLLDSTPPLPSNNTSGSHDSDNSSNQSNGTTLTTATTPTDSTAVGTIDIDTPATQNRSGPESTAAAAAAAAPETASVKTGSIGAGSAATEVYVPSTLAYSTGSLININSGDSSSASHANSNAAGPSYQQVPPTSAIRPIQSLGENSSSVRNYKVLYDPFLDASKPKNASLICRYQDDLTEEVNMNRRLRILYYVSLSVSVCPQGTLAVAT